MTLLEQVDAALAERMAERDAIVTRRKAEMEANALQIATLTKAQKLLQATPGIDVLLGELTACGLWPLKG